MTMTGGALLIRTRNEAARLLPAIIAGVALPLVGCAKPDCRRVRIANPRLGTMRVAVAPALDFTGSRSFDPIAVAELMASELSDVEGFEVLPVSRVLAVLVRQGRERVESPAHALDIAEELNADGILVFGVTEYDPYRPPVVGIAAQLYRRRPVAGVDPVPVADGPPSVPVRPVATADVPVAQTSRVFNAAHEHVVNEVKRYAEDRNEQNSPFGWKVYTASQRNYLRFCCSATIKRLMFGGSLPEFDPEEDETVDGYGSHEDDQATVPGQG